MSVEKEISLKVSSMDELSDRVSLRHGWCEITPLSGELEEGIFIATFADDSRILFEQTETHLKLLLHSEMANWWDDPLDGLDEYRVYILEEILLYYLRYVEEHGENK